MKAELIALRDKVADLVSICNEVIGIIKALQAEYKLVEDTIK